MEQALRDRWGVALLAAVWFWSVMPRLTQTLTAPKYRVRLGQTSIPDSRLTTLMDTGLTLAIMAFAALCIVRCYEPALRFLPEALVLLLTPWAYVVVRDVFAHDMPRKEALVYPLVVLAIWAVRPSLRVLSSLGWLTGLAALLSVGLGLVLPSKGVFAASSGEILLQDKAILPLGTLVGFLTQGNNLGVLLVLGSPFLLLVRPGWWRWLLVVVTLFALVWTASRGAMAAVVGGGLTALVVLALPPRLRPSLGPAVALAPLVAVVAVPLLTHDPQAFTNRGVLWQRSLEWWTEDVWWGRGSGFYSELAMTTERISASAYHGHNEFVHLGLTGGLALLVLVAVLMLGVSVAAGRWSDRSVTGLAYVATLGVTMLLERPLSFVDNLNLFPMVIAPLALILTIRPEHVPTDPYALPDAAAAPAGPRVAGSPGQPDGSP